MESNYDEAIEVYIRALCGFEFNKNKLKKHEVTYIDNKLKLPILNNMSLSLINLGKSNQQCLAQANNMIDQVLKIDGRNSKALIRKCHVLIDLSKGDDCEPLLKIIEEVAFQSDQS